MLLYSRARTWTQSGFRTQALESLNPVLVFLLQFRIWQPRWNHHVFRLRLWLPSAPAQNVASFINLWVLTTPAETPTWEKGQQSNICSHLCPFTCASSVLVLFSLPGWFLDEAFSCPLTYCLLYPHESFELLFALSHCITIPRRVSSLVYYRGSIGVYWLSGRRSRKLTGQLLCPVVDDIILL